jgi:hypothetical protein
LGPIEQCARIAQELERAISPAGLQMAPSVIAAIVIGLSQRTSGYVLTATGVGSTTLHLAGRKLLRCAQIPRCAWDFANAGHASRNCSDSKGGWPMPKTVVTTESELKAALKRQEPEIVVSNKELAKKYTMRNRCQRLLSLQLSPLYALAC